MSNYNTTYHKDKTVTVWNVYAQQWQRTRWSETSPALLASINTDEQCAIQAHCEGELGYYAVLWFKVEALDMRGLFYRKGRAAPVKVGRGLWLGISCFGQPFKRGKHWDATCVRVRLYSTKAAAQAASCEDQAGEGGCLSAPI